MPPNRISTLFQQQRPFLHRKPGQLHADKIDAAGQPRLWLPGEFVVALLHDDGDEVYGAAANIVHRQAAAGLLRCVDGDAENVVERNLIRPKPVPARTATR